MTAWAVSPVLNPKTLHISVGLVLRSVTATNALFGTDAGGMLFYARSVGHFASCPIFAAVFFMIGLAANAQAGEECAAVLRVAPDVAADGGFVAVGVFGDTADGHLV